MLETKKKKEEFVKLSSEADVIFGRFLSLAIIKPDIWLMDYTCENVQNSLKWHSFHQSVQTDIWTGQSLSPNWAEVSALLFSQLGRPPPYHRTTLLLDIPLRRYAMATAINSAQTHTLTLFRCLQPNIQRMCGDQDLKVSVTLNWPKEGEREENIYPCGVLGN